MIYEVLELGIPLCVCLQDQNVAHKSGGQLIVWMEVNSCYKESTVMKLCHVIT